MTEGALTLAAHIAAGLVVFGVACPDAHAQGRFEAKFAVSLAGLTIGEGSWSAEIGADQYITTASGHVAGILRVFGSAEGFSAAQGTMRDGRPIAAAYTSHLLSDDGDETVHMMLKAGNVVDLSTEPGLPPGPDRIPITDAHRQGIVDPITAGLIVVPGFADLLSPEACERTLPVFDGHQRYDVAMSFKRMDQLKSTNGYTGAVVVCAVRYEPIAGYRPDRPAVKYLIAARDVEMWLAPMAGMRILVPIRISIPTLIGTAVIAADKFTMAPLSAAPPAATPGPP